MTTLKFKTGVRCDGVRYSKGQVKSGFSDKEVSLFVKEDVAFVVGVPDSSGEGNKKENESASDPVITQDTSSTDTDNEDIYKELDDNWTLNELKIDADRIGLEFDKSEKILKKDLIKLIIDSGRADEFLAMLEDETEE